MANRSDRGSGHPAQCLGHNSPQSRMGPDPRNPSRPAVIPTASTGRTQDCTRPPRQHFKSLLATREPSTQDIAYDEIIVRRGNRFDCPLSQAQADVGRVAPPSSRYGRPLLGAPRTDPYERHSRIRLLPRVSGGEPHAGPRMKESWFGEPVVGQLFRPPPIEAVLLAAPPERSHPEALARVASTRRCPKAGASRRPETGSNWSDSAHRSSIAHQ
jgi:hypothetical protein